MTDRYIPLGKLVATHGIAGWLKLRTGNLQSPALGAGAEVLLQKGTVRSPHTVEASKIHKGHLLIKLRGAKDINEAKDWVGATLLVAEEDLEPPEPGEYYYYRAIGLDVFTVKGQRIGKVKHIWFKEGGDLYVVTDSSREYLIPAIKEIIEKIDLAAGRMIINPPEGLLDM